MAKKKEKKFVLLKDVVIPAGTVLARAPDRKDLGEDNFEALVGLSKNTCGSFLYCIDSDFSEEMSEYFTELKE